jgi:hypothetical protein
MKNYVILNDYLEGSEKQRQWPTRPQHYSYAGDEKTGKNNKLQQKVTEIKSENLTFLILASSLSFIQIRKKWQWYNFGN